MNLVTKLIEKIKASKEIDFENFEEKFKHNQIVAEQKFKKMQRGASKLFNRTALDYYVSNPHEEVDVVRSIMMQQTNSDGFSFNFANIIIAVKIYAANYMATNRGKTYKEIKFACEKLCDIVDCMNFNFMAHVNGETEGYVKYVNDSFAITPDSYESRLLELVNFVNNTIIELVQGIYNRDRDAVYNAFLALSDKTLFVFDNGVKDIFEL